MEYKSSSFYTTKVRRHIGGIIAHLLIDSSYQSFVPYFLVCRLQSQLFSEDIAGSVALATKPAISSDDRLYRAIGNGVSVRREAFEMGQAAGSLSQSRIALPGNVANSGTLQEIIDRRTGEGMSETAGW